MKRRAFNVLAGLGFSVLVAFSGCASDPQPPYAVAVVQNDSAQQATTRLAPETFMVVEVAGATIEIGCDGGSELVMEDMRVGNLLGQRTVDAIFKHSTGPGPLMKTMMESSITLDPSSHLASLPHSLAEHIYYRWDGFRNHAIELAKRLLERDKHQVSGQDAQGRALAGTFSLTRSGTQLLREALEGKHAR